jgi:hypothetical protein
LMGVFFSITLLCLDRVIGGGSIALTLISASAPS